MKTVKIILPLIVTLILSCTARAGYLLEDYTNYPYVNGPIEGQGPWYSMSTLTGTEGPADDVDVTNSVIFLNETNYDSIQAPTNSSAGYPGWLIPSDYDYYTYASFRLMVTAESSFTNGAIICELVNTNAYDDNTNGATVCHVFIDGIGTYLPGTFQLGIANYGTEFQGVGTVAPPHNFPMDMTTNVWYSVVVVFDNSEDNFQGATLWVNPSLNDFTNWVDFPAGIVSPGVALDYAYGNDEGGSAQQDSIIPQAIRFVPDQYAGDYEISNVLVATDDNGPQGDGWQEVLTTNLPAFGLQPQLINTNYSGNPLSLIAIASGADLSYQWYDQSGPLSGANYTGAQSNCLTINSLSAIDTYHCVVTDFYGNIATSSNAFSYVITTPTAPYFTNSPDTNTIPLFTFASFNDAALGSGPLSYQWFFAPGTAVIVTNIVPMVSTNYLTNYVLTAPYAPVANQTGSTLNLSLVDLTYDGDYYVVASNSVSEGSIAYGPTNELFESPPSFATMEQIHNLVLSFINNPSSGYVADPGTTYTVSTNITVTGYVTTKSLAPGDGLGNSYAEFFIVDTNDIGVEVYISGAGSMSQPPLGANVTVTGELQLYHNQVQLSPASYVQVITNIIAPTNVVIGPILANSIFNTLATNGTSTNVALLNSSLLTFTNCYLYGGPNGQPFGNDGTHSGLNNVFTNYNYLYFTVGSPYNATPGPGFNTNTIQDYQFAYNYPYNGPPFTQVNPMYLAPIPTHVFQLTGAFQAYYSGKTYEPELEPSSLLSEYVVNPPPSVTAFVKETNLVPTVTWTPQAGSTYSVYSSANVAGPYTNTPYGLAYYPTNGIFTDHNAAKAKFYYITSP